MGLWQISQETNAVDGSVTHYAHILTPETVSGSGDNEFTLRCGKQHVDAFIAPWATREFSQLAVEDYDDHSQRVRFRIDDNKPVVQNWNVATNFHALFMPLSTLRKMRNGSVLVIEFSPDFKTPTTATLPIAGIDEAIKQAGCKI
jgi:hypothetical protein